MKNKIYLIIASILLIVIFICSTIWYSENINKLSGIEKIKQVIFKQNENNAISENNITTIDITGLEIGKETRT